MGLNPLNPVYEPGDDCTLCHSVIFNSSTPKYVRVFITGIEKCPGMPAGLIAPNGSFLLTQYEPCKWSAASGIYLFQWFLNPLSSEFYATQPGAKWFGSINASNCLKEYSNQLSCGDLMVAGSGGYAGMFWGPGVIDLGIG